MNAPFPRIWIVALCIALVATAQAVEFSFTVSVDDLGTTEVVKDKLDDGTPFIYPVDEADLAVLVKPMIAKFRSERAGSPTLEAEAVLTQLQDSSQRAKLILLARGLLDSKTLSEDFYDHLELRMADVELMLNQWSYYSSDISEAKLWNRGMLSKQIDPVDRNVRFDGYNMTIPTVSESATLKWDITILPPFLSDGLGLDISLHDRSANRFPLDIPIVASPGNSAEESTEFIEKQIQTLTALTQKFGTSGLYNISRVYLMEAVIHHEIKTRWLPDKESADTNYLLRALTRYAFIREMSVLDENSSREHILDSGLYFRPAAEDIHAFAKAVDTLNVRAPNPEDSPESRKAGAYLLAIAMMIGDGDKTPTSDVKWALFRKFPDDKLTSLSEFLKIADAKYPRLDEHIATAKLIFQNILKDKHPDSFPSNTEEGTEDTTTAPPKEYESRTFGDLTVRYPPFLKEAVAEIAPQWERASREGRETFITAAKKRPFLEVRHLTETERERFQDYGLEKADEATVNSYADLLWSMAEADRLVYRVFPNEIDIWMRHDLEKIIKVGERVKGFSMEGEEINFYIDLESGDLRNLTPAELKEKFHSMSPLSLPILLKKEETTDKSPEELVELLSESDIAGALLNSKLSPEELTAALGKRFTGFTEVENFFVTIHEQAEVSILRSVIASPNRRWYTDGMANYIAAEMTDEAFGNDAGWKVIDSKFKASDKNKKEILKNLDLLNWPASENETNKSPDQLSNARYYYATFVIKEAVGDRGTEFIKQWHEEIRKTPWNRTHTQTIFDAYNKLTGDDLTKIVEKIAQ